MHNPAEDDDRLKIRFPIIWRQNFTEIQQEDAATAELLYLCTFFWPDKIPQDLLKKSVIFCENLRQNVEDELDLEERIRVLLSWGFIERHNSTIFMSPLVQIVLKEMLSNQERVFATCAIHVVSRVFLKQAFSGQEDFLKQGTFTTWRDCQRAIRCGGQVWETCELYLPHAELCVSYIERYQIQSMEAVRLLYMMAWYQQARTRYNNAIKLLKMALEILEKIDSSVKATDDSAKQPDVATCRDGLAQIYCIMGEYKQSEQESTQALKAREATFGNDHPDVAHSYDTQGELLRTLGKYAEAKESHEKAQSILSKLHTSDTLAIAANEYSLGSLYEEWNEPEKAKGYYEQALKKREAAFVAFKKASGDYILHPDIAAIKNNVANIYTREALQKYEVALKNAGKQKAILLQEVRNLYELARQYYERAREICRDTLGSNHLETIQVRTNRGNRDINERECVTKIQGERITMYKSIIDPDYENALEAHKRAFGTKHKRIAHGYFNLADTYRRLYDETSKPDEKFDYGKKTIQHFIATLEAWPLSSIEYPHPDEVLFLREYAKFLEKNSRDAKRAFDDLEIKDDVNDMIVTLQTHADDIEQRHTNNNLRSA